MFKIFKILTNFFIFIFSVTAVLLLLELHFRFFDPQLDDDLFQHDPSLGWKFIPGKTGWAVNPQGFRDKPFEPQDPKALRVMVLGDSFVANLSVPPGDVFTERMETRLENVSVMNFGVSGYGQVQELILLKQAADVYRPHLVVVMIYVLNDFINNENGFHGSAEIFPGPYARWDSSGRDLEIVLPEPRRKIKFFLFEKFHFAQFVIARKQLLEFKIHRFLEKKSHFSPEPSDADLPEVLYFRKDLSPEILRSYQLSERLLIMISAECKKRNIPHFFVIAPAHQQIDQRIFEEYVFSNHKDLSRYDWLKPHKILAEYAEKNGWGMLDLYPRLAEEFRRGERLYDEDDEHWTAAGNRIVADEILKFMKEHQTRFFRKAD